MACVLVGSAYARGGVERLTWEVRRALQLKAEDRRVGVATIIGPGPSSRQVNDDLLYAGPSRLSLLSKVRFGSWVFRRSLNWGSRTFFFCMVANQAAPAYLASILGGAPYVVWAHGAEVWGSVEPLTKAALRGARFVVCSSEFTRTQLIGCRALAAERSATLHPPVSTEILALAETVKRKPGEAGPTIVSIARLAARSRYKGLDTVIKALSNVARAVPEVRYRIIGGGDDARFLMQLAQDCGVAGRVEILQGLDDDNLARHLEEARIFALPSRASIQPKAYGEGFGIVFAEAAAFGRPVVGSREGGAAEAIVDGVSGVAVDPRNVSQVADALIKYLRDPEAANQAGAAGRKWVLANLTPITFAHQLTDLLTRIGLLTAGATHDQRNS